MQHISTKSSIMVVEVALGFMEVYQRPYFAVRYAKELGRANLLLIPSENIREGLEPVFPEITSEYFRYIKEMGPENVRPDIAVDEEHFHKLLLHAAPVALPTMVVREEILKETADLVTGFLSSIAKKNHRYEDEMDTYVNIIVDSGASVKKIMFSGRVSECKDALDLTIKEVFVGDNNES